jgi:murein DD-endopeptidase MepM/ murein hydrolase activator NlpD
MRERLISAFCRVSISDANDVSLDNADDYKRGDTWQTGDRTLISASVTLSSNSRSSSCTFKLNDPDNKIAGKYIQTSFKEKGIVGLPPEASKAQNTVSLSDANSNEVGDIPPAIIAEARRQGVTAPHKIAFILAVAEGESSFNHNAYNDEGGAYGQYGGRGLSQITHDYNYKKWGTRLGVDLLGNPDLAFKPNISTTILVGGLKEGWTGAGGIDKWMPSPDSDRQAAYSNIQGGVWRNDYEVFYQKWLKKIATIDAQSSTNAPTTSAAASAPLPESEEVSAKGRVIEIQLGFEANRSILTAEFIHTGTDTNHLGETIFSGQSIRAALNRIKRNAAYKDITLAQLAQKVAKAYGLKAVTDPGMEKIQFQYVDQSGITDHQLLVRECNFHGYQISDKGASLVFSRPSAIESGYILYFLGGDLDTWSISDKAADQLEVLKDASTKFTASTEGTVRDEAKNTIDPKTGQVVKLQAEPQRAKTKTQQETTKLPGSTGSTSSAPVSDPTQTGAAVRQIEKRVKGLPANFTVPTTPALLRFTPTTAFNTAGHPHPVFNRIWMVDTISHHYDLGTVATEISAFTPMDVKVIEEPSTAVSGGSQTPSLTGWVQPIAPGSATSCGPRCEFGHARGKLHAGLDLGGYGDDTVMAAKDGVVILARNSLDDDYGKLIKIRHADGWQSWYAHLANISITEGTQVKAGQAIGVRGGSGEDSLTRYDTHLHFEIRDPKGNPIDPRKVLPQGSVPIAGG